MQGLNFSSMKKHPAGKKIWKYKKLIPLYVCVGAGCVGALLYTVRLATQSPDVSWDKKKNPEPWQEFSNKKYKFWSTWDYSKPADDSKPKF